MPLRAMQDLVQQILQEQDRPEGADTSIWLAWDKVTRQNVIKLYLPRWNTIKALQGKTVINLDATPYPLLQRLFPAMKPVRHAVPENMHVTQITDSKLTGRSLESPATRRLVEEALRHVCANAERPLIFCPKKYNPGIEDNEGRAFQLEHPGTLWGHYGRDNRAINDTGMMAADVLVVVGTPHHPPNELRAELHAFRGAKRPPAGLADAEHTHKPYAYQDAAGRGKALRQRVDPDPEVQAFIDHQVAAEILQAIGRARPALRTGTRLRVNTMSYKNEKQTSKEQDQAIGPLRQLIALARTDQRLGRLMRDISVLIDAGQLDQTQAEDLLDLADQVHRRRWRCTACGSDDPPWIGGDGNPICNRCHADLAGHGGFPDRPLEIKMAV